MKKFLSIFGVILLLFISALILSENPDPNVGDTSLFFMNGSSTNLQDFRNLYNLSPNVMYLIYGIALVIILLSLFFNKLYFGLAVGNLILYVPIFIVHKNTLFFEPFRFADTLTSYVHILVWVWYVYLAWLYVVLFVGYILWNKKL